MIRRLIAGLVVLGLAIGVWALWPQGEPDPSPTTTVNAVATTTTSSTVASRTTSSVPNETHVVTTVEEAEEILRQLWFGWFEGIYNQDEERIREVVGTEALVNSARDAFDALVFSSAPQAQALQFEAVEILTSTDDCLVLWVNGEAPFLESQNQGVESVEVLRWRVDRWVLVSSWKYKDDLWEADCESVLEPLS